MLKKITNRKIMTASRMKMHAMCERSEFYRYGAHLNGAQNGYNLAFGSMVHAGLEEWWKIVGEVGKDAAGEAAQAGAKVWGVENNAEKDFGPHIGNEVSILLERYTEDWKARPRVRALEVERKFIIPAYDALAENPCEDWELSGKIDVIMQFIDTGRICLLDHKCLGMDEEISTVGGIKTARQLLRDGKAVVYSMQDDGTCSRCDAVFRKSPDNDMVRITTKSGRTMTVTVNHPVLTDRGLIAAGSLDARFSVVCIQPEHVVENGRVGAYNTCVPMLIGDGSLTNGRRPRKNPVLSSGRKTLIDVFMEACLSKGNSCVRLHGAGGRVGGCRVHVGDLTNHLKATGLAGCASVDKFIPEEYQTQTLKGLRVFMGALWSTDGCCKRRPETTSLRVVYSTVSSRLAKDVQRCLWRLGVWSTLYNSGVTYRGTRRDYYQVTVVGNDSKRAFVEQIVPHMVLRQELAVPPQVSGAGKVPVKVLDKIRSIERLGSREAVSITVPKNPIYRNADGLVSHNTSTQRSAESKTYFRKLEFDYQISMYMNAAAVLGYEVDTFIYDVLIKPPVTPKLKTPENKIKRKQDGSLYKSVRLEDESAEDYAQRYREAVQGLNVSNIVSEVYVSQERISAFMRTCRGVMARIDGQESDACCVQNATACKAYGRDCPYLGLCCENDSGGLIVEAPHTELQEVSK